MSEALLQFLISKRTTENDFSHMCVNHDNPRFTKCLIIGNDIDVFYELCRQHLSNPMFYIGIIERPTNTTKLFIDLDFRSNTQIPTYTSEDIATILNAYNDELAELHIGDEKMEAFILEMNLSLNLPIVAHTGNISYKNGIHIIYPKVKLTITELCELHNKVKTNLSNLGHIILAEAIDSCITSGLYMYGFGKHNRPHYSLTKIYSHNLTKIDANVNQFPNNLLKSLSIRT